MLNYLAAFEFFFFFSSRRRHTRFDCDWSSDVCSSDLEKSREKLSALGYVASGKTSPPTSIDPKDRIDVANDMHDARDRKSTRLNSSHSQISYAVFCLKKKKI